MAKHINEPQIRNRSSSQSYSRGAKMAQQRAVFAMVRRGNEIEGRCEGSSREAYQVRATLDKQGNILLTSCNCDYSYAGDCKHVVALLVTYAKHPEEFTELPSIQDLLLERSKEELVNLIEQMVARYPELQSLIDRPIPNEQTAQGPIDLTSIRHELRQELRTHHEWGETRAADTVLSIVDSARAFAQAGQWHNASAIYQLILEECAAHDGYPGDNEGALIEALNEVVEGVMEYLGQLKIANDDSERRKLVKPLLEIYLWDVKLGGADIGSEHLPDNLLPYITAQDVPEIRKRVQPILQAKRKSPFGNWGANELERFLIQLDKIEGVTDETILARLRQQGLYTVLFEKLISLQREDEAIEVAEKHLWQSHHLRLIIPQLIQVERTDAAIQLAQSSLSKQFDENIASWLAELYYKQQDRENFFELQLQWMQKAPSPQVYASLRAAAEKIGVWQRVRPEILKQVQNAKDNKLLIQLYLADQEWDAAWSELEKIPEKERGIGVNWSTRPNIDMLVAELSGQARPEKAIPVYLKYTRRMIEEKNRPAYQAAAAYLTRVSNLYMLLDDLESWQELIENYRVEFRKLRAFQDELNQAGL